MAISIDELRLSVAKRLRHPLQLFQENPLVFVGGATVAYLLVSYLSGRWNERKYAKPTSPPVYNPATQHLQPYSKRLAG